jgi:hypothetical protein
MTLATINTYTQYQRTELKYEAKISAVENEELENKDLENEDINDYNLPVIYANEDDLTNGEYFQKNILQSIIAKFNLNQGEYSLFPNGNNSSNSSNSPYESNIPSTFYYGEQNEYYEKISFEFDASATIKTPSGEYNIELKLSFTQEYYEKNETQIAIIQDQFKNPFEIEFERDDDSLKELKQLNFIFAPYKEEKNEKVDIFEQLKKLLSQKNKMLLEKSTLDNFEIWQKNSKDEMNIIAAQKDGFGVFLANSYSQSSQMSFKANENGYTYQASYSSQSSQYIEFTKDLKA